MSLIFFLVGEQIKHFSSRICAELSRLTMNLDSSKVIMILANIRFSPYFEDRREKSFFFIDTDILSDYAKNGASRQVALELQNRGAILLYSLPSIMELGFGPETVAPKEEINMYVGMYRGLSASREDLFVNKFRYERQLQIPDWRGKWIGLSPDSNNWFAAKKTLVNYMTGRNTSPRNAKELQIDALMSCMAWNAGAVMWTNNVKDHLLACYYINFVHAGSPEQLMDKARHMPPTFDTEMLTRVLAGESFNVYTELMKRVKDDELIRVLKIAEGLATNSL